jgi:hypothetical protein
MQRSDWEYNRKGRYGIQGGGIEKGWWDRDASSGFGSV